MRRWYATLVAVLLTTLSAGIMAACGSQEPYAGETATAEPARQSEATPTRPPVSPDLSALTPTSTWPSESALVDIRRRGVLRVGVLYNYPPFGYLADNGRVRGYEADLVHAIAQRWGVEVSFVQVTRQTRLPILCAGEVDMLAAAVPHRREMQQFVEFTDTTFLSGQAILVKVGSATDLRSALTGGPLATVGPEAQQALLQRAQQLGISPDIRVYETVDQAIADLSSGTVYAVVSRRESLLLPAQTIEGVDLLEEFVQTEPYAFAVRRGDTPLRDLLNLTLQDVIAQGEIGAIFSNNFYGRPTDLFKRRDGEPLYSFDTFPTEITFSESVVERIRRGEPLRVAGIGLSAQPALYDGQPIVDGFDRAVLNEMARRWNVPITEVPASMGETGLALLEAGQADMVTSIRPDVTWLGRVAFSQPYYTRGLRVIHMGDVTVLGVDDLEFKPTMIVPPFDVSEDIIRRNNDFPRIAVAGSPEEAFRALVARGVYAVVGDEFTLTLMARADNRIAFAGERYRPKGYAFAVSRFDPDFLALVDFTLQDMYLDGTLDTLRQQYFGPYLPEGESLDSLPIEIWPGDGSYLGVGG